MTDSIAIVVVFLSQHVDGSEQVKRTEKNMAKKVQLIAMNDNPKLIHESFYLSDRINRTSSMQTHLH